jgi:hypothetical protein
MRHAVIAQGRHKQRRDKHRGRAAIVAVPLAALSSAVIMQCRHRQRRPKQRGSAAALRGSVHKGLRT